MPATSIGFINIADATIGAHFAQHPQFAVRHPGQEWKFRRVRVPLSELRCLYPDPGVQPTNPAGLMGSVGQSPSGHRGTLIAALANTIHDALMAGTADLTNPALKKVLAFRAGGSTLIGSVPEPLAVSSIGGDWFVREGTHRAIAIALIPINAMDAIDFESAVLV